MYKSRIIETIVFLLLNVLIAFINYLAPSEALKSLLVITICVIILIIFIWIYDFVKYQLLSLLFDNYKKMKKLNRIIAIIVCVIFFMFTAFTFLIEHAKYVYLNDKLSEKESISDVYLLNRKTNKLESYKEYDFNKDKSFAIFDIEYKNINRKKRYIIYKTDARYQLLKTYAFLFAYKDHDNSMAFNYLALSFGAILYYKKETKEIRENYFKLVKEYEKTTSEDNKDTEAMLRIQQYLSKTKLNSISYNDIVSQMRLMPKYTDIDEMKVWHNYFKNESDKELSKITNELNKLNEHFKNNILVKYQK